MRAWIRSADSTAWSFTFVVSKPDGGEIDKGGGGITPPEWALVWSTTAYSDSSPSYVRLVVTNLGPTGNPGTGCLSFDDVEVIFEP